MKRLPKGHKAQIMGTRVFQTMYTADQMRKFAQTGKPLTNDLLRKMHHEDQFGLFCDYDEFEQIARAIEAAHSSKGKHEH